MKRHRISICAVIGALLSLGGCEMPGREAAVSSVGQFTFAQDLGNQLDTILAIGDTTGASDDFQLSCNDGKAGDVSYLWTAPAAGDYDFSTLGRSIDTVLEVLDYSTGASLGCNDDYYPKVQSLVTASLSARQAVLVVVEGSNDLQGPFWLNITPD